jgi:hypothetical protein
MKQTKFEKVLSNIQTFIEEKKFEYHLTDNDIYSILDIVQGDYIKARGV